LSRVGERSRGDPNAIWELHRRGVSENNAGHPTRALRLFRRALGRLDADPAVGGADHDVLRARLLISAAMSESELNGLDAGLRALEEVRAYVERTSDQIVAVHLYLQLGFMRVRGGHFVDGLAALDTAANLISHADPAAASNILLNRGTLYLFRGDLELARQDLTSAAAYAREHGLLVEECKARHNLGYVEFLAGNLALALQTMDEAARLGADVSQAVILLDRSRVLIEAGLHRESDEALVDAAELFRSDRLWKDVGEVELARAECALLDGEIDAARRLAGRARDRFRRRGNERWRRDAELVLLHADLAVGRPGARLARPALRLAEEFRTAGLTTRARTAQLIAAEALLRAGQLHQATEVAAAAGTVHRQDPISARLHTRLVRSKLLLASGSPEAGLGEIHAGLSELARHQASFGSIDLQTASAVHGRQLAELDLSMALSDDNPEAVLTAVERGRATSSRLRAVRAPQDEIAAGLLAELRQLVERIRLIESDPESAATVAEQRQRVVEVQRLLRSRSWRTDGSGHADKPAAMEQITAGLDTVGAALACYVEVDGWLHAVVMAGGRGRIVRLTAANEVIEQVRRVRADLDVMANGHLPDALLNAVGASLRRSLTQLDDRVVRPLAIADRPLVIVPTGILAVAPWTNMPSLRGRPVVVSPSATAWLAASSDRRRPDRPLVSAFAGPDLPRAAEEVRAIGDLWPASAVLLHDSARRDMLVSAMTSATVVHVAAHGQHQAENPLFSSIRLADGPVFAYELDQTARAAEHVVLAACELGQATIRPGDEALGLTSVLLHLGTRCVVSGVSRVHDDVSAEVMTTYHRLLASGRDSAQALADACGSQNSLPAPFVCFGATW